MSELLEGIDTHRFYKNQAARRGQIAYRAGEKAKGEAERLLRRHANKIGPVVIDMIACEEFRTALRDADVARREGCLNDTESEGIGLVAILTEAGAELLRDRAEKDRDTAPHLARYAEQLLELPAEPDQARVFALPLPDGTFTDIHYGIELYGFVTPREGGVSNRRDPMTFTPNDVVAIAGYDGTTWVNPNYTDLVPVGLISTSSA